MRAKRVFEKLEFALGKNLSAPLGVLTGKLAFQLFAAAFP